MVRIRYEYRIPNQLDKEVARNKLVIYSVILAIAIGCAALLHYHYHLPIEEFFADYFCPLGWIIHSIFMILDALAVFDNVVRVSPSGKLDYFLPHQDPHPFRFGYLYFVEFGGLILIVLGTAVIFYRLYSFSAYLSVGLVIFIVVMLAILVVLFLKRRRHTRTLWGKTARDANPR